MDSKNNQKEKIGLETGRARLRWAEQTFCIRPWDQKQFPTIPPLSLFSTCWQYLCQKEVEE